MAALAWVLLGLYALQALIALSNLLLMRRPRPSLEPDEAPGFCVLIPARNEEENLRRLVPAIKNSNPGLRVYVFDDESEDGTAEAAATAGAIVVRADGPLPPGWTGKNRACHELAKAATEDCSAEWLLFLDADTYPSPDFLPSMRALAKEVGARRGVLTGFPTVMPGRGVEPLFLAWVGWGLLSSNLFGWSSRTEIGANRFTNGQVHAWRSDVYAELWPNEAVRGHIMEDVMMGRHATSQGYRVEVANLSHVFAVKMYETWRETFDGMSKNAYEAGGSVPGAIGLAFVLLLFGWGWLLMGALAWAGYLTLVLGGAFVSRLVRTSLWPAPLLPVSLTIGAVTMIRSTIWHRTGRVRWKGRDYAGLGR